MGKCRRLFKSHGAPGTLGKVRPSMGRDHPEVELALF